MIDESRREAIGRYAAMQKSFYDAAGVEHPHSVVGCYDFHEIYPYETFLLFEYGDVRRPIFADFSTRRAFDIACGEGRMVRRMRKLFGQVDGADISQSMIDHARAQTPGSDFWVTDGLSAGDAPSDSYDFVFCTISLQHVCVFTTRDLILKDLCRILKPDGKATFQMLFARDYPLMPAGPAKVLGQMGVQLFHIDSHHARWFDDKVEALATNSGCDVVIGTDDLVAVRTYYERYFRRVEFWLADISIGRDWGLQGPPVLPQDTHPNSHLHNGYWGTHFIFIHCDGLKA